MSDAGGIRNTKKETDIIHDFELDMIRYKITVHTVLQYYEKITRNDSVYDMSLDDEVKQIAKIIENEFRQAEEIERTKSALIALKYQETSNYFIFRRGSKTRHGNIYVVNEDDIIKTVYRSEDSGWFSSYLKNSSISPRRRHKMADKALKGTRRESVWKKKDK